MRLLSASCHLTREASHLIVCSGSRFLSDFLILHRQRLALLGTEAGSQDGRVRERTREGPE